MPKPRRATPPRRSDRINRFVTQGGLMDIHLAGSRPTRRAPKESFTGTVWQDPIITPQAPMRINSSRVAFEPGARTAWHTHPLGQTLYVLQGVGRFQAKGGPVREIKAGDVVWIPPGEKHWRGADHRHGSRRDAGIARRQPCDLDGICDRRRVCGSPRLAVERMRRRARPRSWSVAA